MKTAPSLVAAATLLCSVAAIQPARQPHQPTGNGDKILTWNETMVSNQFGSRSTSVSWLSGGEDGQYIYGGDDGSLVLENFVTGESSTFVAANRIPEGVVEYWLRPDFAKVLFATNYTKQYRHSYFADYSILDVASGELTPLVEDQVGDIQYAEFAPAGDAIAFVRDNNLFLNKNGTISQITDDGSPDMFNGVPDWVYEEEIFGSRSAIWFSPDGEVLAYLSFNETGVETFTVQYFMDNQKIAPVYPRLLDLRYPKVGTTNPTVALTLLDIGSEEKSPVPIDAFAADDLVIGELAWVTSEHENMIYRAFNRVQDTSKHVRVNVGGSITTEVVRERDGTDGWLDNDMGIRYVGPVNGSDVDYYVDVSDESGYQHIYLFAVDGSSTTALTEGEWEVASVLKIDSERDMVYYTSTQADSTERHIYSVSYSTLESKALVDDTVPAVWSASFSSGGEYYILSYSGPDVPYQELYAINDTTMPLRTITSNEALWDKLQDYNLPNITYFTLDHPDGYSLNVMEMLPPNFDPAKKYPVLFTPYGGPGSQEISKSFQGVGWNAYIASDPELEFVQYTVDNRGTGFKGRAFRALVVSHLGDIFGWSYGGYLSAKVVEADSGAFTLGLIVAPVSDWRFYDSMYTERYMKTSQANPDGYAQSAVRNADGFRHIAGGFSIQHGLGDDNVHYQNTAALLDLLVGAGVPPSKMQWRVFTDSDHGISYNGASTYLYKFLTELLYREKTRETEDDNEGVDDDRNRSRDHDRDRERRGRRLRRSARDPSPVRPQAPADPAPRPPEPTQRRPIRSPSPPSSTRAVVGASTRSHPPPETSNRSQPPPPTPQPAAALPRHWGAPGSSSRTTSTRDASTQTAIRSYASSPFAPYARRRSGRDVEVDVLVESAYFEGFLQGQRLANAHHRGADGLPRQRERPNTARDAGAGGGRCSSPGRPRSEPQPRRSMPLFRVLSQFMGRHNRDRSPSRSARSYNGGRPSGARR
ncbi:dipeptidyl peptidase IV N-terminal region-domain-containing protein [Hypoxylon sp. FL1284]|nr:dipeptidyl peptidase IV N-terminal region-domain-containing protein [Hypoxylon sp. FL1284]